mgnify:CR=1 FL=1
MLAEYEKSASHSSRLAIFAHCGVSLRTMSEGTPKRPSFGSKMFGGAKNLTPTKVPSFTMQRKGSKAAEPTGVGGAVWVRDDEVCYRLATVTDVSGGEMKVRVNDTGATLSGKDFHPLDPQDEQEADLVQMVHVDTPNILNTLRKRHAGGCAYTNVGQKSIVISVNPYRWIDIYGTDVMREHYEAFGSRELSPHVFAIASDAYRALCVDGGSQAIITSGESGSGKSVSALSIMRLLPYPTAWHPEGHIQFAGTDLLQVREGFMRDIRGNRIAMIFQEPLNSLNPLHSVEKQISEVLLVHKHMTPDAARARAVDRGARRS